ncbi:hypothetical protein JOJ88_002344 [Pantoea cypripedii]|nr:hypothetical protein [Pantoea cypripedii]
MSKRSEIFEGADAAHTNYGLVYTEVLGWVDLGHAQGEDIRKLMNRSDGCGSLRHYVFPVDG